jgi:biopolymer transport protein ExbD
MERTTMADLASGDRPLRAQGVRRNIRIDMTPMVDLAFLLLTFFILTTSLLRPSALQLVMPSADAKGSPGHALNVLLTRDAVYFYEGVPDHGDAAPQRTDMRHLRASFLAHNRHTADTLALLEEALAAHRITPLAHDTLRERAMHGPRAGLCAVRTAPDVPYRTVIALMDELDICGIGRYSITEGLLPGEQQAIAALP